MKIYWKDQSAYDEKENFLAIIHQMPNNSYKLILNYPSKDIDYRQLDVTEPTVEKAMERIETVFKEIKDVSEIVKLLMSPCNNDELPSKFLSSLSEFSIHHS